MKLFFSIFSGVSLMSGVSSSALFAEDAVISYAGQQLTVSLPPAAINPATGRVLSTDRVRAITVKSQLDLHDAVVVKLRAGANAATVAARHQLVLGNQTLAQIWRMAAPGDVRAAIAAGAALRVDADVEWVEHEISTLAYPRIDITPAQWHLTNDGTLAGTAGNDLNVAGAWTAGATGTGINITVVDSGLDLAHPDLVANIKSALGKDFIGNDMNPAAEGASTTDSPDPEGHATWVAGVAAARGDNGFGVTGVAYQAGIISVRLITGVGISNSQKAGAFSWLATTADTDAANRSDISTNSWGPSDNGIDFGPAADPSDVENAAWASGVSVGRGGKGVVYIFASGNGRQSGKDSSDFDGYSSSRFVMAIGATNATSQQASYSEGGVCLFASAPVGDTSTDGMVTTDRSGLNHGKNAGDYTISTDQVIGTSFAAPQAAGVAALILQKNPNLTWRDVRHIIARTAVQVQPSSNSWRSLPVPPGGSSPLHWSPNYGFGRIDATAAVAAVASWSPLAAQSAPLTATKSVQLTIPDGATAGIGGDLAIVADNDFRVEEVEFATTVLHANQSQLTYTLISPAGTKSVVNGRTFDSTAARARVFTSYGHWGERANGTWRVEVADRTTGTIGTLGGVSISVYGYRESTAPGNSNSGSGSATAGLLTTNDPFLLPHPPGQSPPPASNDGDGHGGLCGLGSGSIALMLSGFLAFLLRRNLRA